MSARRPFMPHPGFDPFDGAEDHIRLSADNPVSTADAIDDAWRNGLGLGQAQALIARRTGQTIDRETIRARFVELSELHAPRKAGAR